MINLDESHLQAYVNDAFGPDAELLDWGALGSLDKQGIKKFGYGKPLLLRYAVRGEEHEGVLSVMKGDKYGHQFYWDRAAILLFQYETSHKLPGHVRPLGLGYVDANGDLHPLQGPQEFFILNEKIEGYDYYHDLARIRQGDFRNEDLDMARGFARWLADIHAMKLDDPDLYYRHIRNLLGSSECIMGLVDEAYPHPYPPFPDARFAVLEKKLIDWRWRLRGYAHRLSTVHGDFHPWNIMVRGPMDFSVLDRSRGEWGEPAGDLASIALNYLLFGIIDQNQEPLRFRGPFRQLFDACFETYLQTTGDTEMLEVMAPFFVFRCLVVASPEWYPDHPLPVRAALLRFMERVLERERFDYRGIDALLEER